jgi:hypothetical protein
MKVRRAVISLTLFVTSLVALLRFSRAPLKIDMVWASTHFVLVSVVTFFLCATFLSPAARMIGTTIGVVMTSVITTWISSKFTASLRPLEPVYFAVDLFTFGIEAMVVIGVVWGIDVALGLIIRPDVHDSD